ncbi:hypothetical protein ACU4GD_19485 [Cupriavidus basilensis]
MGVPLPTLSRRLRELERAIERAVVGAFSAWNQAHGCRGRLYEHASRGIEALLEAEQAVISDQTQPSRDG